MKISKIGLIDTNIILYAIDQKSEFYGQSKKICDLGLVGEIPICISSQIVSEFLATATNPKRFHRPITPQNAVEEISRFIHSPYIYNIYQSPFIYETLIDLVQVYHVSKQDVHDAHLVATMLANGITRLYTYNHKDFEFYQEIEVLTP